ncbi:MAG: hypothetical protein IKY18_05605 [Oscillospiraceae bacterium]|nr:hypothetical protein [Oscillospiraceae bacterium]
MGILYLRPSKRRPIRTGPPLFPGDMQSALPCAWCRECGKEVFVWGEELCPGCKGGTK